MNTQERHAYPKPTLARRLQKKRILACRPSPSLEARYFENIVTQLFPQLDAYAELADNSCDLAAGNDLASLTTAHARAFKAKPRSARVRRTRDNDYQAELRASLVNKIITEPGYRRSVEKIKELLAKKDVIPGLKENIFDIEPPYGPRLHFLTGLAIKSASTRVQPTTIERTREELMQLGAADIHFYGQHALHVRVNGELLLKPKFTEALERSNRTAYHLTIQKIEGAEFGDLLRSRLLSRTYSLDLSDTNLTDIHAVQLAGSRQLKRLRWLDLSENDIGEPGVLALAQQTVTPQGNLVLLQRVHLLGNPFNPIAHFRYDQGDIYEVELPPSGVKLEETVGAYIPWLHPEVANGQEISKNRFGLGPL